MALVIDLKPNEKLLIGRTVVTNDDQRTRLRIDGDAPILREKDTMTAAEAVTPSKKLYFTIQEMYLANPEHAMEQMDDYFLHYKAIVAMAPHIAGFMNSICVQVLQGAYYKALKLVQDLITFESEGSEPARDTNSSQSGQLNRMYMESQMLSQSADQLQETYDNWPSLSPQDRSAAITYNRKLWMVFFDGASDKGARQELSTKTDEAFDITANIINLYNFIYKRSVAVIESGDKEKLITLIDINREAAKGLKT